MQVLKLKRVPAMAALLFCVATPVNAQKTADSARDKAGNEPVVLEQLTVVGSPARAAQAAGSAAYLNAEALETMGYSDVQRVLRQVNGVYAIDDDGYGLRPNIGIRGSGTDRNGRITVLEDGVPAAPAVYSAPSAYFFPTMARISAVEVLKGSSTIRSGPRTTGGVINLISTPIPERAAGLVDFSFGSDTTLKTHAWAGSSAEHYGWLFETVQQSTDGFKRLDDGGDTGYRLEDYLGKFRVNTAAAADVPQSLEIKLGRLRQDSNETYLGLTDADFAAMSDRRYAGSQQDNLRAENEQIELRHNVRFSDAVEVTTVAYRNRFTRNWYKLNDLRSSDDSGWISIDDIVVDPVTNADQYRWLTGASSPDGALRLRNNNRAYDSRGVQSVLGWNLGPHGLELGVRYHEDNEDRYQWDDRYSMVNGDMMLSTSGARGSQDNRIGEAEALAVYLQDDMRLGRWIVTPGLRYETIDLTRTDYLKEPDGRSQPPTGVRQSSVSAWMPGLGISWLATDALTLFASGHSGFNPPGPGSDADPEKSINIETGARWSRGALQSELIGFWNDYSNLVGTCTASSGGGCTIGDQYDGGEAQVRGVEASLAYDIGQANNWPVKVPARVGYTWTDAEFSNDFESDFDEWGVVTSGDKLPYLPEQAVNVQLGVEHAKWRVNLAGTYLDDMSTNAADTAARTESAFIVDLVAGYQLSRQAELYTQGNNLTDEEWIASRRPAGVRPGLPQQVAAGIRVKF